MTALWLSRSWNIHLMSSVTLLRLNMHFFLSCISSQGSTLSCLAAVLYLFHIFHMVSSSFLLQSQHCTVFRVILYVLLSHNSLSKYLVKGTGSPHSFFFICTESENNLETEKDMELMGCKQLRSSTGPGKFFPSNMWLLPAREKDQEGEHKLQVSVTSTSLYLLLSFKLHLTSKNLLLTQLVVMCMLIFVPILSEL